MDGCAPGRWTLFCCRECGSAYLDPRPTPDTIALAYRTYRTHTPTESPGTAATSRMSRLRSTLLNGYLNHHYDYNFRPAMGAGRIVVMAVPSARGTAATIVRHLGNPRHGARLLDVGCGNGAFLARMAATRWTVEGLEPDVVAVQHARAAGLRVHEGHLDESAAQVLGAYDALTLSHVIEHLHDPLASLRLCFNLLRPGGTIWIATPNIAASGHRLFGRNWFALDAPRHLVLFSRDSIEYALREAGFDMLPDPPGMPSARQLIFPASHAIASGRDPVRDPQRLTGTLARQARRADLAAIVRPRSGEEIVVVAQRPLLS